MPILNNLTEKNKRNLRIALVAGAIFLAVFIISSIGSDSDKKPSRNSGKNKQGKFSLLTDQIERESWMAAQGTNIKKLQQENEEFRREIESLKKELEMIHSEQKRFQSTTKQMISQTNKRRNQATKGKYSNVPPLPEVKKDYRKEQDRNINETDKRKRQASRSNKKLPQNTKSLETIKIYRDTSKDKQKKIKSGKKEKKKDENDGIVLSSGSFMRGVLLNGIDAATDFNSKGEPYPVLINIVDPAKMPNLYRLNLKNCFVIGAGYGNLADERAYIRTERISCISEDGRSLDASLKGHVIGEDGKLGIRGKLVSKQGQMIAKTLFAGTLSGLAKAFKPQQSVSINLNPNGNTGQLSPEFGDIMKSAGAEGAGTALNKVADFYLKMAEKVFPIIEISAGRKVDILILEQSKMNYGNKVKSGG